MEEQLRLPQDKATANSNCPALTRSVPLHVEKRAGPQKMARKRPALTAEEWRRKTIEAAIEVRTAREYERLREAFRTLTHAERREQDEARERWAYSERTG